MDIMTWTTWIIVGALVGWLTSIAFSVKREYGTVLDIGIGLVGGLVGGLILYFSNVTSTIGFNLWNLLVAIVGAAIFLALYRLLFTGQQSS